MRSLAMATCCSAYCKTVAVPGHSNVGQNAKSNTRNRREVFAASVMLLTLGICQGALAAETTSPFRKYLKKKTLDPLETYIPTIILSQTQFQELEGMLVTEKPEFKKARSLLRSGPAGSLRSDIRAVAQYAAESGDGKVASDAVNLCLRSLEDLDSLLLRASKNDASATVENMKDKLGISLKALDSLLQTVPASILAKGKAVASAYLDYEEPQDTNIEEDADIKTLEDIITL